MTNKWLKNCKVRKDKEGRKTLEATEITQDYEDVSKEDVLNGLSYDEVSELQKMVYHCYKKIEELEKKK